MRTPIVTSEQSKLVKSITLGFILVVIMVLLSVKIVSLKIASCPDTPDTFVINQCL